MRILQISPATPGWFYVYAQEDGSADFDPVAFWALVENDKKETKVVAATATDLHGDRIGVFEAIFLEPPSNLIGVMGPGDSREEWEVSAREFKKK